MGYNWDQTPVTNVDLVNHSIGHLIAITAALYCFIAVVHAVLCYVKSLFLYRYSRRNAVLIDNAFETEFELDDELSDVTEIGDDEVEKTGLKQSVSGNGDEEQGRTKYTVIGSNALPRNGKENLP